ncbi:hypothetical protein PIROE2DRAFT_22511, partial [Piromyces sp. E2]
LVINDEVLGYGSHGTVVYKGTFQGRKVAVKRLLIDFYDIASKEVQLLQESDDHPNVIRYFARVSIFYYFYYYFIFNILIAAPKKNQKHPRVLISDFGLCKKLEDNQSSFNNTIHMGAGTVGWRAPETSHNTSDSSSYFKISSDQINVDDHPEPIRITKAIDIFSAGCVFFYVLTNGQHPFGERYYREANIINNKYNLNNDFDINIEAKDLIEHMIQADYRKRPSAKAIMSHPYFWSAQQRLNFLQEASDRFEIEPRDPPSPLLQLLETNARLVVSNDWYKVIDRALLNNLGKYRKYSGQSVRDLLRALRNK